MAQENDPGQVVIKEYHHGSVALGWRNIDGQG